MELKSEYKQTEIGVIPEDWSISDLQGVCAETITYGIVQCGPHVQNGVPYIRVSDMNSERLDVTEMLRTAPAIAAQFSRSRVSEGDIVYALRGKIGEVRRVNSDVAGANLTQGTAKLSPSSRLDSIYLLWSLRSQRALRQGDLAAKGSTFREITLAALRQIQLPVPPISEQRAIATALSDMDALLAKIDQLIAKKRDLKQAAMQQLLTGQTRLPGFSGEWEVKSLGDVADVIDPHPSHRAPDSIANGVPFVGIGDLDESGNFVGSGARLVSPDVLTEHSLRYNLADELIGLGRVASIGKVVALKDLPERYAISPTLGVIRGRTAKRGYLLHALKSSYVIDQFARIMSGSTRASVGMEVLRVLDIPLPATVEEQTAIATVLSDMDVELTALEARRYKTRALKQGMMQALLTGRIRLVGERS